MNEGKEVEVGLPTLFENKRVSNRRYQRKFLLEEGDAMDTKMKYADLLRRLKRSKEPLSVEAAEAMEELLKENRNYKESYEGMYRDYQRVLSRENDVI